MTRFVALYSGSSINEAKLIAITGDPEAVKAVAGHALKELRRTPSDPASRAVEAGRRKALQTVLKGDVR